MTGIRDMSLIRTVSAAGEEASPRGDPRAPQVCGRRTAMNSIVSTEPCGSLLSSPQGTHRPELFQTSGSASAPTPEKWPRTVRRWCRGRSRVPERRPPGRDLADRDHGVALLRHQLHSPSEKARIVPVTLPPG
jgi:hypothetical protein